MNTTKSDKPTHACKNCRGVFYLAGIAPGPITPRCCDKPTLMELKYESPDSTMKRIALQNAEFDAVAELSKQHGRIQLTPVVDDDYPSVRHDYEFAVGRVIDAFKRNGRTFP